VSEYASGVFTLSRRIQDSGFQYNPLIIKGLQRKNKTSNPGRSKWLQTNRSAFFLVLIVDKSGIPDVFAPTTPESLKYPKQNSCQIN
jgi:hypothetical protein